MNKLINWIKKPSSDRVLLVILLILLNLVSSTLFLRIDLTSQKAFSISKASKEVVKYIETPLSIKVFFSKNLSAPYNNVQQYILDLLSEYKSNGSKNFSYQIYDMDKEENQIIAQEFGLGPVQIDNIGTSEISTRIAWMGIIITYGDYIAKLDSLKSTHDIEYKITTTISKIISAQNNNKETLYDIGYITGHNENILYANYYAQTYSEVGCQNFASLLSDIYSIKEINLTQEEIPANLKTIIINNPKTEFSNEELIKIDQFIMNGGNVIFFVDPLTEKITNPNSYPEYTAPQTNIFTLLDSYGATIENSYIMDNHCLTQHQNEYGKQILNWVPIVSKENVAQKNPITQNLGGILFFCNGPIDISKALENKNIKTTVLAKSSKESWTVNKDFILYPGYNVPPKDQSTMEQKNMAVLLEGSFDSAFMNEKNSITNFKSKSPDTSRIIVVSSGTLTTDTLISREGNDTTSLFVRNAIDYVNNNEDFCTMRTKGTRLDFISIKSEKFATIVKLLNEFGLALVVLLIGFFVWRMRLAKRYFIHQKYHPEDSRIINKKMEDKKND